MPDRWNRVETLFEAALAHPPEERIAWLEARCDDHALRAEVQALLAAHDRTGGILDRPLPPLGREEAFREADLSERLAGPYRLLREVGRGGMGTVYLAERADGAFSRKVAVKVLRPGFDADERLQRFRSERQILASLQHPNIATLYDGGTTEAGRPYFVMEYVAGRPLDLYCDETQCPLDERLRLFITVCETVQHAHQGLVVHRDLKPSNILVAEDGTIKLLDFGIAKLLNAEAASHTQTGRSPMTPAYASPEQIAGEPITTASDIYQLGLVLYTLLAGRPPYDLTDKALGEVKRAICGRSPAAPSTVLAQRADASTWPVLPTALQGDLDTIVLKALRKEPDRRYDAARRLADDLKRYLNDRPVTARPATWAYRTTKFVRRHQMGVAGAALVLLLLVGGIAGTTWQAHRASEQARRAEAERDRAEQVTGFMMGLFEANDPSRARGDTVTARELMKRGIKRAEALEGQPAVQSQMLDVVGQVYRHLGQYDRAQPLLERALAIRRNLYGEQHPDVAESLDHLAYVLIKKSDYGTAEPLLRQALALRRKRLGPSHPKVASTLSILGGLLKDKGAYAEADSVLREALALHRKTPAEPLEMTETLNIRALLLQERGRYEAAEPLLREALALRRERLGEQDPRVAMSLNNLAMLLRKKGDHDAAEPLYRRALAMKRKLYGDPHPSIAASLTGLGLLLHDKQAPEAAHPLLREALAIRRAVLGEEHPSVAVSLNNLGNVLEARGRYEEAKSHLREARLIFRQQLGDTHPTVAYPTLGLSRVLMKQQRASEAEPLIREALQIRKRTLPENHWQIGEAQGFLGKCLTALGRYPKAESLLVNGHRIMQSERGPHHPHTQQTLEYLIELYKAWDRPEKAAAFSARLTATDAS